MLWQSVRKALPDMLREFGYAVRAFSSADEFLASDFLGIRKNARVITPDAQRRVDLIVPSYSRAPVFEFVNS